MYNFNNQKFSFTSQCSDWKNQCNQTLKLFKNNKMLISALLIFPEFLFAAPSKGSGNPDFFMDMALNLMAVLAIAVIVFAIAHLIRLMNIVVKAGEQKLYEKQGVSEAMPAEEIANVSLWERLQTMLTDAVPVEQEAEILTDHNYDGIQELDNNLPPWWLWMFYATTAFAFLYIFNFHFREGALSSQQEYALEVEHAQKAIDRYVARQANAIDENNIAVLVDNKSLAEGEMIFQNSCAACHLQDGGGSVGPNLTDDYWLHGGSIKSIFKTIKYGVPEKGMIAWKTQLRPSDIHKVASYITTLKGTTPQVPKEPQGELYDPAEEVEQDSAKQEIIGSLLNK